jgi:hypothetical protein
MALGLVLHDEFLGCSMDNVWYVMPSLRRVIPTITGYDAPFHMSEECANANVAGPRAIIMTGQLGLWLGFVIIRMYPMIPSAVQQ